MNNELLPCPFCGSKKIMTIGIYECSDCGAVGPSTRSDEKSEKLESWNYRALQKMRLVNLKNMERIYMVNGDECREYNRALDDIKTKYGELYAEVK